MIAKAVLKLIFVIFPLAFVVGLVFLFDALNFRLGISMIAAIIILLAVFLLALLSAERKENLPFNIGGLISGSPFIIALSGTLLTIFIFLLAMLKAVNQMKA